MRIGQTRYRVEWVHLAFATAMAAVVAAYLLNVRSVSTHINNTIFVQPVALIAIGIYLFIAIRCVQAVDIEPSTQEADVIEEKDSPAELVRVAGMVIALGIYTFILNAAGFDIATWLFALAAMFICGERSALKLAVIPILLGFGIVHLFQYIIPFPIPTTII